MKLYQHYVVGNV